MKIRADSWETTSDWMHVHDWFWGRIWFYCIMFQDLAAITIITSITSITSIISITSMTIITSITSITSLSSLSSLRIFGRSFCAPGEASSAPKVRLQSSPSSLHRCRSPPSPPAKANGRSKPDIFPEKWFGTLCYRVKSRSAGFDQSWALNFHSDP